MTPFSDDLGFVKEYLHSNCEARIQVLEAALEEIEKLYDPWVGNSVDDVKEAHDIAHRALIAERMLEMAQEAIAEPKEAI